MLVVVVMISLVKDALENYVDTSVISLLSQVMALLSHAEIQYAACVKEPRDQENLF